jgi:hypothetical protein
MRRALWSAKLCRVAAPPGVEPGSIRIQSPAPNRSAKGRQGDSKNGRACGCRPRVFGVKDRDVSRYTNAPWLERAASNDLACPVWKTGAHPSMPDPQFSCVGGVGIGGELRARFSCPIGHRALSRRRRPRPVSSPGTEKLAITRGIEPRTLRSSMIRKSGSRFSEQIMLHQNPAARSSC